MPEERDRTNTWVLFPNRDRKTDKHPTHGGSLTVQCPHCGAVSDHFIDGWVNEGSKGKFQAGKVKAKDKQPAADSASAGNQGGDHEEDFPF